MGGDTTVTEQYWNKTGLTGLVARSLLRTLQVIFAIVVAILYGLDLYDTAFASTGKISSWIYAEFAVAVSLITCILHLFVAATRFAWCLLDWVVFILWVVQFGVFGTLYIGGRYKSDVPDSEPSISRMQVAIWIDMVNMLLWLASALQGVAWCVIVRKERRRARREEAHRLHSRGLEAVSR
ncbi:uncharacterized protein F4822DRAFT_439445 [Hypoxylon trugodes]|uniref:uncharacterized protein n=1 Tax=Hypoxylon trugodes TaxID=326681 RepID=UPI00219DC1EA|nr:uncharacterized protein F4822DRAFT_439445 [Hypoxylon trugodes]KAI1393362.1 hypothetical protein F4822DRAFT_439445 [Hypoxylon trugodes]